jgi:hypothetical protein
LSKENNYIFVVKTNLVFPRPWLKMLRLEFEVAYYLTLVILPVIIVIAMTFNTALAQPENTNIRHELIPILSLILII